jgi:hypothetical protein
MKIKCKIKYLTVIFLQKSSLEELKDINKMENIIFYLKIAVQAVEKKNFKLGPVQLKRVIYYATRGKSPPWGMSKRL